MVTHLRGPFFALLSALLFGISPPLAKQLVGEINPQLLAGLLYLGSGAGLGLLIFIRKFRFSARAPGKHLVGREWIWLGLAIAFGGVAAPVLLMVGLANTAATSASLLLNLEGVFTALLAWFIFREGVNRRVALGFLLLLLGGVAVSWTRGSGFYLSPASLLIVGACACWGIDNNFTRKVSHADSLTTAALKGLVAGIVNVGLAAVLGATTPILPGLVAALGLGLVSYGLSLVCFIVGLRHIGAARTGAYFATAPFIGALVAAIFFREHLAANVWLAGGLMAVGVWLHLTENRQQMEGALKSVR